MSQEASQIVNESPAFIKFTELSKALSIVEVEDGGAVVLDPAPFGLESLAGFLVPTMPTNKLSFGTLRAQTLCNVEMKMRFTTV